jgi:mannosyltransferase OCH1-like enzyme
MIRPNIASRRRKVDKVGSKSDRRTTVGKVGSDGRSDKRAKGDERAKVGSGGIPRIIHQTCKDKLNVPLKWREYQASWIKNHPSSSWAYALWDDVDNDRFVREHYPEFYQLYLDLPYPINRVDLVRYLYLHRFGGFYVDMDCQNLKPLDDLCCMADTDIIVGERLICGTTQVECAFMGSVAGHPFWLRVAEEIRERFYRPTIAKRLLSVVRSIYVLLTTGPLMLHETIQTCRRNCKRFKARVRIFPQDYFFVDPSTPAHEIPPVAYLIHYSDNSWVECFSGFPEYVWAYQHKTPAGRIALLAQVITIFILAIIVISWFLRNICRHISRLTTIL